MEDKAEAVVNSIPVGGILLFSLAGLVIIIVVGYIFISRRMQKLHDESERTEHEFERTILNEFAHLEKISKDGNAANLEESAAPPALIQSESPAENQSADAPHPVISLVKHDFMAAPAAKPDSRKSFEDVVDKLKAANIFKTSEGPYPMAQQQSEYMLITLKSGKTVFVIPYFESEHFIINNLKKADYLIMIMQNGEPVVVNKFGGLISGNL